MRTRPIFGLTATVYHLGGVFRGSALVVAATLLRGAGQRRS
jgi:hypothetical protein